MEKYFVKYVRTLSMIMLCNEMRKGTAVIIRVPRSSTSLLSRFSYNDIAFTRRLETQSKNEEKYPDQKAAKKQ